MEIKIKKELIKKRKKEVPPHIVEMGLNMLFVEPNDVFEYIKRLDRNVIPLVDCKNLETQEFESVLIDLSDAPYDERLDNIGFAKQNNTSMIVVIKDIILDEYQVYMHRIYGADAIMFPLKPITSKFLEKAIFVSESMGMLPIPLIEDKDDLDKVKEWEFIKVIALESKMQSDIKMINKGELLLTEYDDRSGLALCLNRL